MTTDVQHGFPGFAEDAPLDLSDLTPSGEAGILDRLRDGTFDAWAETAAAVGYCANPVRFSGSSITVDTSTGEVLDRFSSRQAPLGVAYRACGNRRAAECPACSRVYARDTFAMIRAGIAGGKTVPESLARNPLLFVTFTAPSFGHVHGPRPHAGHRDGGRCRPRDRTDRCPHGRPAGCMAIHRAGDPLAGSPLCVDCYDWDSAIVWQWWAPELWRRTTIALRRHIATALGVPEHRLGNVAALQYAKVAEYQARGLIHFHALIRLDDPDGPGTAAPLDGDQLSAIVQAAARATTYTAPPIDLEDQARILAWGQQLDIRVVRDGTRRDHLDGPLTPGQVAGYLAKYATKDATSLRDPGQPRPHLARISATCRALRQRATRHDGEGSPYLLLDKWAHARLPRPLLHQIAALLSHPRCAARSPAAVPALGRSDTEDRGAA